MPTYHITGGQPLIGSVRVGGAKNVSYKLMIAALLADTPTRLLNFSRIRDVEMVAEIINSLGAQAREVGDRAYLIDSAQLRTADIDAKYGDVSRASTMFIPALLHRFGHAHVPLPGGDKIGVRNMDFHIRGLEAFGVQTQISDTHFRTEASSLHPATYRFPKNSHTGTETLLMLAAKIPGESVLENAAEEVEIDDMIALLNEMGADIKRQSPRRIVIHGSAQLRGSIHQIMPDQNQVVSYACGALITGGDIVVEDAHASDIGAFLEKLKEAKAGYEVGTYGIRFFSQNPLQSTEMTTGVYPGFKTDWQPLWAALMTQAEGVSLIHETIYDQRFGYVPALQEMGAQIEFAHPEVADPETTYNFPITPASLSLPHAIHITGPTPLQSGTFSVKDLRHGATLMIAALAARGTTVLHDPSHHIDRGYERLHERLNQMGATISLSEA